MNNMNVDYVTLHYRSVLNDFSNQFLNEEFSDCILNAEGRSLKVHKAMLCAQSSFLEKMILEHQNIGDLCFIIEGVSFDDLTSVVQFMYNGSAKLYKQNFGSFLVVAELLGVKWLDRVQILNDTESSPVVTNVSVPDQGIKSADYETQPVSVFKDLTNCLDSKGIKRKKHIKSKKHCKRSKCTKEDHRNDRRKLKINHSFRHGDHREKGSNKETHLADMDENTFCTALGLKKNELQSRENYKPDVVCKTDAKIFARNKTVPPLIKINRELKSSVESYESRDSNMFVSEINTVYIEDKNLSFLNIGANELCIRENNIEIECDVLDASTSQFVIDKEPVGNIVELREENIIQAEFVDINPGDEDSLSSYSDSTTRESVISAGGLYSETRGASSSSTSAPPSSTGGIRKSSRPCRKKACSAFVESTSSSVTMTKKSSDVGGMAIDKTYLEGSTLFWCDVCQRTYHTKTGLNQHKRYECCKEPAFACPRCEKRFKRKSSLVRHAITLHDEAIFPTRTKLLSKLTGQGDRSILTIGERAVAKAKLNTETSAALTLQLDNSDWSSPSSSCSILSDDCILTPVSRHDVDNDSLDSSTLAASPEAPASDQTNGDSLDAAVADINGESNAAVAIDDTNQRDSSVGDKGPEVPESNLEEDFPSLEIDEDSFSEQPCSELCEINADDRHAAIEKNPIRMTSAPIEPVEATEQADNIAGDDHITNGSIDFDLSLGSPEQSNDAPEIITSKHIEVIALEERDAEIDCGVEPLPDQPTEFTSESSPSPVSLSPPPPQLVTPVEAVEDTISIPLPWIPSKKKKVVSKALNEAVKHGSVIIRARGKILRKSSRKKIGPNKKAGRGKDSFQEYLDKAFELKPFIIKLDRYRTEAEANDSEKLHFLSNFNLKRNSVFPVYSEHAYAKYALTSPQPKSSLKTRRSNLSKIKKVNKTPSVVIRKRNLPFDISKFRISRTINKVEIERLEETAYASAICIQKEHSYNFSENDPINKSNDYSLSL